jgi:hypothetical protein
MRPMHLLSYSYSNLKSAFCSMVPFTNIKAAELGVKIPFIRKEGMLIFLSAIYRASW